MRLAPVFLGSLARRRMATLFSLLAIVLGVALGMAVQAVHQAALSEFGRGLRTLAGQADLQIVGPRRGFDENLYAVLASRPEVAEASPVIELEVKRAASEETLQLLGIDVFALARVTPALLPRPNEPADRLATLAEDAIFLSRDTQTALGLQPGERIALQTGTQRTSFRIAGDIPGAAENRRLAVMDIAAVQTHFAMLGRISRLDLRLTDGVPPDTARRTLQALLPPGVLIEAPQAAADQAGNLSRAYRVNLTLLATIALLTGGFLVFSAQALSVVRRRTEFAFLRALGLARHSLFAWLLGEGAVVGLVGGVLGVILGHGLAWAALAALGGDLGAGYFSGLTPTLQFQPDVTAAYVALGLLAGIAGAWLPAREAATVAPAQALKAGDEGALPGGHGHPWLGLGLLGASLAACAIPPLAGLPVGGYLAVACLLAGSVMLLPRLAAGIARLLPARGPVSARLAAARLGAAPGHAVVAAAGVLTSVALAAAMAIMVASFRDSVDQWLNQILPAELYLRAGKAQGSSYLDDTLQAGIRAVKGIERSNFTRHDSLRLADGQAPVALIARPLSRDGKELPLVGTSRPDGGPAIWISEAMQDIYGWRVGQQVALPLAGRQVNLHVAGVWRDYARQTGAVMIDLADYQRLSGDRLINDAAIYLAPGADAGQVAAALGALAGPGGLEVARPGEIRAISLGIFDRTFAVTYLLEAVAVAIGLAGVAASFAALAAARRREFGMLRHLGLSRRQIGWMLAQEGALAAGVGVIAGLLAGGAIGLVLIEVINRQSFHWSMDLHVPWGSLAVFASGLIALAALAAVLAGRQAMRQDAVLAVREDW
ncbi:ABC transporter permease [Dechloromonas denitrificans]|uniref:ABC transporter permease n=1 Tax=Dechloromonas denitrificans TaxID=281362 RepID=UPI001CFA5F6A|nr:ABC transporter permease [Dechloromonas denitrificans]UCV09001.1 ABC transporter permease [Dechloromonas denitrificans]